MRTFGVEIAYLRVHQEEREKWEQELQELEKEIEQEKLASGASSKHPDDKRSDPGYRLTSEQKAEKVEAVKAQMQVQVHICL